LLWRIRLVLPLFLLVGLFASAPVQPTNAAIIDEDLDNTLDSFGEGAFYRTALSSDRATEEALKDAVGAVQLAPSGDLNPWGIAVPLPISVANTGLVGLGNRLFLVGGSIPGDEGRTDSVWTAAFDPQTGQIVGDTVDSWENRDPLPAVQVTNDLNCNPGSDSSKASVRHSAAVSSIALDDAGAGVIFVIGGSIRLDCNFLSFSSIATQIGQVDADGNISWSEGPTVPSGEGETEIADEEFPFGIENAASVAVRTSSGQIFVYLIGGLRRFQEDPENGGDILEELTKEVFYAEYNATTGSLGEWRRAADVPVSGDGLIGTAAIAASFDVGGGPDEAINAFFVAGGQTELGTPGAFNPRVFRADINRTTGAITWNASPGEGTTGGTGLPDARAEVEGVSLNGKLYIIGGIEQPQGTFLDSVLTANLNDDLSLQELGPNIFFVGKTNPDPVLQRPRSAHAVAVLRGTRDSANPTDAKVAWVYVAGGSGPNNSGEEVETNDTLYLGRLGGADEAQDATLATNGWYYARATNVEIAPSVNAEILEFKWTTKIDRSALPSADIRLEYRTVVTTDPCDAPGAFDGSTWQIADGDQDSAFNSVPGENKFEFPDGLVAKCFQYRAFFERGSSSGTGTPVLLKTVLRKNVPGNPDLKLFNNQLDVQIQNGQLTNLTIRIENKNTIGTNPITQPANYEVGPGGQFLVDLCISEPNQPLVLPQLPVEGETIPACSKAYALVNNDVMIPNAQVTVTNWKDSETDASIANLADLFDIGDATGAVTFEVAVLIDPNNLINEGNEGGEDNNIGPLPVARIVLNVEGGPTVLYLPIVRQTGQ
jgi:hypothetical protein